MSSTRVTTGAQTAAQLLAEAHMALRATGSPAKEVTAALRLAHGADPRAGLRTVLRSTPLRGGGR